MRNLAKRLTLLDRLLVVYTTLVGLFVALNFATVDHPVALLAAHVGIIAFIVLLPPRGAAWESRTFGEALSWTVVRQTLRFLRHMYPLGLVIFYFEEVGLFVNALWRDVPYWFETSLYAADRAAFGDSPGVLLAPFIGLLQDEIMHFFYFSYYLVVLGGGCLAYIGRPFVKRPPAAGFEKAITSSVAAFLFAFVWYPYLPARGPWEDTALMEGLPAFQGVLFTPLIEAIIGVGAVSGACFPSAHVAGAFGMSFGLLSSRPRLAGVCVFLAGGMALSCLYTRYHHGLDIVAGLFCAAVGFAFAQRATANAEPPRRGPGATARP